jgi:hypothetical protein
MPSAGGTFVPDPAEQQLVADVARDLVARAAPEELPLFRTVSTAYFRDPGRSRQRADTESPLAFGVGEGAALLLPIALPVAQEVLRFLLAEAQKAVKAESGPLAQAWVRHLFRHLRPPEQSNGKGPALTAEQLARVRAIAVAKARGLQLPPEKADLLADALVGGLVAA